MELYAPGHITFTDIAYMVIGEPDTRAGDGDYLMACDRRRLYERE